MNDLHLICPGKGYRVTKTFPSVTVPQKVNGSPCLIAQVVSDDPSYPRLELLSVAWRGKYKKMPADQRKILVEHIALRAKTPESVQEILDSLSLGSDDI